MEKNEVYVTTNLNDENLWQKELKLTNVHWINKEPDLKKNYQVRTRHRGPLVSCKISKGQESIFLNLKTEVKAAAPGQSAVIYDKNLVLGGGIIN